MTEIFLNWINNNIVELLGAALGILYIFFSIKQNIFTWPTGLLTSLLYIIVFFRSGFYADMGLQFYYVFISIYGWYYWLKGGRQAAGTDNAKSELPVKRVPRKVMLKLAVIFILIYVAILFILLKFTDSTVPFMDTLTTALSIIATWMLAKKYIEHWLIWIFVDIVSAGLYVYKSLWPTVILFIIYTILAVAGYREWKKSLILTR
ncbi:MAG: nicotinamide mononucleotide transporter [Bacteroidales bacterium]|jgi:nicotinamide mononucleotide transporter|nr:nicotinamide mononucleotide transporter [Bacteroidales bacterium]